MRLPYEIWNDLDLRDYLNEPKELREARNVLLEHHTSQMQGYRYHILALVLGIFAVLDFWSRFGGIMLTMWLVDSGGLAWGALGFIVGAIFYSFGRFAWYGEIVRATVRAPMGRIGAKEHLKGRPFIGQVQYYIYLYALKRMDDGWWGRCWRLLCDLGFNQTRLLSLSGVVWSGSVFAYLVLLAARCPSNLCYAILSLIPLFVCVVLAACAKPKTLDEQWQDKFRDQIAPPSGTQI